MDIKERRNRTLLALSWGFIGLVGLVTGFSGLGIRSNALSFILILVSVVSVGVCIKSFNRLHAALKSECDN